MKEADSLSVALAKASTKREKARIVAAMVDLPETNEGNAEGASLAGSSVTTFRQARAEVKGEPWKPAPKKVKVETLAEAQATIIALEGEVDNLGPALAEKDENIARLEAENSQLKAALEASKHALINKASCGKCGHEWVKRTKYPRMCPACQARSVVHHS